VAYRRALDPQGPACSSAARISIAGKETEDGLTRSAARGTAFDRRVGVTTPTFITQRHQLPTAVVGGRWPNVKHDGQTAKHRRRYGFEFNTEAGAHRSLSPDSRPFDTTRRSTTLNTWPTNPVGAGCNGA